MDQQGIPGGVIAGIADVLAKSHTHAELDTLFMVAGAPGDPPDGSKAIKANAWLRRVSTDKPRASHSILGKLLEEFMDKVGPAPSWSWSGSEQAKLDQELEDRRKYVRKVLASAHLEYVLGGRIVRQGQSAVVERQLADLIRQRDMPSLEAEFARATSDASANPRHALSAAANILEAVLGEIIELMNLTPPNDRTLRNLWKPVKAAFKLDPKLMPDQDLATVVGAMAATVEGLAGLRDDKSTAHAMKPDLARNYRLQPRHARLAINAAYGLTAFLLETMDSRQVPPNSPS